MVYEFKSRATGNVVMTQAVAERLLGIIGKAAGATGIITVDQMPAAIAALQSAIAAEKTPSPAATGSTGNAGTPGGGDGKDYTDKPEPAVGLSARAFPLIEMMQRAAKGGKDITWGI